MIDLEGVAKTYSTDGRRTPVLQGIDLHIEAGDYVAIMGPSGTGKTTLMNILGLLDRPTAGRYEFEGKDVTTLGDAALSRIRNRRIGFVFQLFHLLERLTVLDNVLLPLLYTSPYPDDAVTRASALLHTVGLADRTGFRPSALSGGQRQRAAVARALINDPALLLADEPTGNLDSAAGAEVMDLFDGLNQQGRTIVVITHDTEVARWARRLVRISEGRLTERRPTSERPLQMERVE